MARHGPFSDAAKLPKARRRGPTVVACASFVLALAALLAANLRSPGERVIVGAPEQSPLARGMVLVSQEGAITGNGGAGTGRSVQARGAVDTYTPDANGDLAPENALTDDIDGPAAFTFDASGDLWVSNNLNSTLVEFSAAALAGSGAGPSVTISHVPGPWALAFDREGDLWLVYNGPGSVCEYTRAELLKSGSPSPHVTISGPNFSFATAAAFDASGDLWIVPNTASIVEYSKAELAKKHPSPTVTISSTSANDIAEPEAIAFDSSGDLWTVNFENNSIIEFSKNQLRRTGDPTPIVSISSSWKANKFTLDGPSGLAFDRSHDLWVVNYENDTAVEFDRAQLAKSGSPNPVRTIAGPNTGMDYPFSVAIQP